MQTLAYKSVINVTKQMAIFNHKNKICGNAKNYLLKIIGGGAKAPPPAPRYLIVIKSLTVKFSEINLRITRNGQINDV